MFLSRRHLVVLGNLALAFSNSSLFAWGHEGHQIVATVAAHRLNAAAAAEVGVLLDGQSLADVAALPDTWRSNEPETSNWHFVNIPKDDTAYDEARDCPPQASEVGRDCAVAAIEHFTSVVSDATAPKATRARALTFLVHFVGDIHQPLHSANNNDLGGNKVPVTWFGAATHTI
ncbi:MAG: S1/P1 nuclease, partial [Acidobacteriota bacterium]